MKNMADKYVAFGDRLRQIRKEMGMTQEELAQKLGTTKQVLCRYESNQRAPKITAVREYAEKLGLSVDYMLGDSAEELTFYDVCPKGKKRPPFRKIFVDVTTKMGLDIPAIARLTGLSDNQVRLILFRDVKDAPLSLALLLTETLGVPLEVWTGDALYAPAEISVEAREVALAYDRAEQKDKNVARLALDLERIQFKDKA
jgi:transcriptional regulator with XRE-family HTH domain